MALIKCPECEKEISDKAESCPNCGCPSSEWKKVNLKEKAEIPKEIIEKATSEFKKYEKTKIIRKVMEETGANLNDAKNAVEKYLNFLPHEKKDVPRHPYTICPECGEYNQTGVFVCVKCRHRYTSEEYKVYSPGEKIEGGILPDRNATELQKKEFCGVYRSTLFHGLQEVYCPRCGSENCSHYQEQRIIPAKTKTRYSANLNPLRPFTLVNKKEKVVRKEEVVTEKKFLCNKCGNIFD